MTSALLLTVSLVQPASMLIAASMPVTVASAAILVFVIRLIRALIKHKARTQIPVIIACLALCIAYIGFCLWNGGPLGVRFALSDEALHREAMKAVDGTPAATPVRIGGFRVRSIDVDGGIVRFETYRDEQGPQGLAFFPLPLAETDVDGYTYLPFGWHLGRWFVYFRQFEDGI